MAKNNTIKSNIASSRAYLITGLILASMYFVLKLLLQLFRWIMTTNGLDTVAATEKYPVIVYIYGLFYFLVPISYFLGIPAGVILIIIGIVKRNKRS